MPGLIIGGKEVQVPGVHVRNFKDEPKLALRVRQPGGNNDGESPRKYPVSLVVLHTTKGIPGGTDTRPQVLRPGFGPDTKAEDRTASYWSTDPLQSGAHIVIDHDGSVACLADLKDVCAYHAGDKSVNHRSVGIEIFQGKDAELYEGQLEVVVKVVDTITLHFGIQRQIPGTYRNRPAPRLDDGAKDVVGVVGHREVSNQRGFGDPGDFVFQFLERAGYERFDFYTDEDLVAWKTRQKEAALKTGLQLTIDGIPGPATRAALQQLGYTGGLWMLPPKSTKAGPIEGMLDGFLPMWTLFAGDREAALEAITAWLSRQR